MQRPIWRIRDAQDRRIVLGVLAGTLALHPFDGRWPLIRWLQLKERVNRLRLM